MPLDKAALGVRYACFSCDAKFYDLNREAPTCPSCGADQRDNPDPDPREALMERFTKRRRRKKKSDEPTAAEKTAAEKTAAEGTAAEATSDAAPAMELTMDDDDDDDDDDE